jgi:hypothetical protein
LRLSRGIQNAIEGDVLPLDRERLIAVVEPRDDCRQKIRARLPGKQYHSENRQDQEV